ncbi:hypothetical protein EIN_335220 [Entamoeba invadens IP1]|uniref:MHD domain-containing protein n=1 Tax=Entamoeba invadens IP1 TaxID=370355 RepID=L7FNI4_ENTIV|nr:hypothetical protein EIN_335220 [Entamoeba invadens IP1]ELP88550.1 hypothetical protein EIN_335220 [Entamoeba invadens IP1]|eukprot:XP_004255321.1 hypothetical protein EIN_335220 [Entamoeba invadens IP1]
MITTFSIYNSKGSRLYYTQVGPMKSETKEVIEIFITEVVLSNAKPTNVLHYKRSLCYHLLRNGCYFVLTTKDSLNSSVLILTTIVDFIQQFITINESNVLANVTLIDSILYESIGNGVLHSYDQFDVLRTSPLPSTLETEIEMVDFERGTQQRRACDKITDNYFCRKGSDFDFLDDAMDHPVAKTPPMETANFIAYEKVDRFNVLPAQHKRIQVDKLYVEHFEEINVTFRPDGDVKDVKLRGSLRMKLYTEGIQSLQLITDTTLQKVHINPLFEGEVQNGVLTWNNPHGCVPVFSYETDVKTFPVVLTGTIATEHNKLIMNVSYNAIGGTYVHAFCFTCPDDVDVIKTVENYTVIGRTVFVLLGKNATQKLNEHFAIELLFKERNAVKCDVPFGWITFETNFSASALNFTNITQKGQKVLQVDTSVQTRSGDYVLLFD